jgi:hypothetical protein
VGILVSRIFIAPALLVVLAFIWVVTVLGADQYWNNQRRTQHDYFEISIHDVLLLNSLVTQIAIHSV